MSEPEYTITDAATELARIRGITVAEIAEAVFAPSYNRAEHPVGDELVFVYAEIPAGRRLMVVCDRDRLASRRIVRDVREMLPSEYDEFIRRSR